MHRKLKEDKNKKNIWKLMKKFKNSLKTSKIIKIYKKNIIFL